MAEEKKDVAVAKRETAPGITFKGKDGELSANVEVAIADVKKYLCPKASDAELYMFVNIARSQGLNPFNREIHFVPFKDRHSIVVGYEVYLKRMEASGLCEGWKVEVRQAGEENEEYVFITWRKGWREPFEWPIKTNRFVKKYAGSPWETMPEHMKRKTAISQGIRMAYADVISGLPYSHEETVSMGAEVLDAEMEVPQAEEAAKGEISLDDLEAGKPEADPPAPVDPIRDMPGLVDKLKKDLECEDVEPETCVPWDQLKKIPADKMTEQNVLDVVNMLSYPLAGEDPKGIRKLMPKYLKAAMEKLQAWEKEAAE